MVDSVEFLQVADELRLGLVGNRGEHFFDGAWRCCRLDWLCCFLSRFCLFLLCGCRLLIYDFFNGAALIFLIFVIVGVEALAHLCIHLVLLLLLVGLGLLLLLELISVHLLQLGRH